MIGLGQILRLYAIMPVRRLLLWDHPAEESRLSRHFLPDSGMLEAGVYL